VREALPDDLKHYADRPLTKQRNEALFSELADKYPDQYPDIAAKLTDIARRAVTTYGRSTSFGPSDFKLPESVHAFRDGLRKAVIAISQNPRLTGVQKNEKIAQTLRKASAEAVTRTYNAARKDGNAFAEGIQHGFRGNPKQLSQMLFGDIIMSDNRNRPVPVPGLHGYAEGVTPLEYWAGAYGSRKGLWGVQAATADTGFFTKQLSLASARLRVMDKDCGVKDRGVLVSPDDEDAVGRVLAETRNGVPAGTVLTEAHLQALGEDPVLTRSVLTCGLSDGVCQKCAGHRETGDFPDIGSYIGVSDARTLGEPLTQAGLGSKHVGGELEDSDENRSVEGFDEINQFFQVPKTFVDKAALAPVDGRVDNIAAAPQGGSYISVGGQQVYAGVGRKPAVKVGDSVEAGDSLSDGIPNPAEVVAYKGLGEGRRYFADRLMHMLSENSAGTHRRNVESATRAFLNKVRITDPDGVAGYEPGSQVQYSELQSKYQPRRDAESFSPTSAVGRFLERPVLHYTIGTRITPRVAGDMKKRGVGQITVHKEQPGFEPDVVRLMDATLKDPDWKVRMAGFNLQRGFLDAARKGSESSWHSTSPVPLLMNPQKTLEIEEDA